MIVGEDTTHDRSSHLAADLANDLANPFTQRSTQNLEPVFGDPDNMIAMMNNGMRGFIIGHHLSYEMLKPSVWKAEDLTLHMEIRG